MYTFLIDFNFLRKNSYRDHKTPFELAKEDYPDRTNDIFNLPPIVLDNHFEDYFDHINSHQQEPSYVAEVT
ncbi:MAG: hypothetical protein GY730_02210 [bacterium]|nr:hypothetical protein [bacterium]